MSKKLYLIRHGETEGAESKRYKGHIDVPLSENGIAQMKRLSRHITREGLNAVYSSDLIRAQKSAEIIAEPFGLKPVIMDILKERSFGVWEGMTFDEIEAVYPEEFRAWGKDPLRFSPLNGETTIEVRARAMKALDLILNSRLNPADSARSGSGDRSVAVVSHGGIIRIMLCELLGVPLENLFRIEQDFSALNVIEFWNGYPVVKLINYTL
jgi:alpha-ribazole phosphatase/probable phosphoglycerate mutase